MKDKCVYITCNGDSNHRDVTVSLYTYLKFVGLPEEHIYIICKQEFSDKNKQILQALGNVTFISPGNDVKKLYMTYKQCVDITGKLYTSRDGKKTAIVVYVYYYEYWHEIYNYIKILSETIPVDVHVYLCNNCSSLQAKHIMNCEQTDNLKLIFNWTDNKGRDVRSFLSFIKNKHYLCYDKICKIHTKKTTYLDDNWRSTYLSRLLSPIDVNNIWSKINHGYNLYSVEKYLIHEKHTSTMVNYKNICKLVDQLNIDLKPLSRYKFFAGTMFWCNYNLCKYIDSKINITNLEDFETEPIKSDGSLAHAWERVFNLI